jgi:hypothetical protein
MKLHLTALALACALPFAAGATTINWGVHDTLELAAAQTSIGFFTDSFLFSLPSPAALYSTVTSNDLTQVLGISNLTVTLYADMPGVDPIIGSFRAASTTGSGTLAFGSLLAGSYYYLVTGSTTGSLGGYYSLSSTTAPVPEPQTVALFLGGLGVVAFLLRRYRS